MPLQDIQFVLDKPKQKLIAPKKSTPQNASAKNETQIKKSASVPTKKIKKKSFLPKFSPLKKPSIIPNKKSVAIPAKSGKATKSPKSTSASKPRSNTAAIPDFSMDMPKLKSISSGLSGSGTPKKHASGFDVSSSSINSGGTSNQWDSSSGGGSSTKTAKKIITTYDISPYVNELKRDIKANWSKPAQSKRVELFLRIAKDGRLIILNVKRTSDNGDIDNAALNAVKKCLPLNPLPAKYNKSYLDVIFVFDSNTITSR